MFLIVDVNRKINKEIGDSEPFMEWLKSYRIDVHASSALHVDTEAMVAIVFGYERDESGGFIYDEKLDGPKHQKPELIELRSLWPNWDDAAYETVQALMAWRWKGDDKPWVECP